jgi:hypothetical protein
MQRLWNFHSPGLEPVEFEGCITLQSAETSVQGASNPVAHPNQQQLEETLEENRCPRILRSTITSNCPHKHIYWPA